MMLAVWQNTKTGMHMTIVRKPKIIGLINATNRFRFCAKTKYRSITGSILSQNGDRVWFFHIYIINWSLHSNHISRS